MCVAPCVRLRSERAAENKEGEEEGGGGRGRRWRERRRGERRVGSGGGGGGEEMQILSTPEQVQHVSDAWRYIQMLCGNVQG